MGRRFNANGFDRIISLGRNCEVSARIQDYRRGKLDSYPFSWMNIEDQTETAYIMENIGKILGADFYYSSRYALFYNDAIGAGVHSKGEIQPREYDALSDEEKANYMQEAVSEIKSRYSYLIDKWNALLKGDESALFVLKIDDDMNPDDVCKTVSDVRGFLETHYASKKFLLLCVFADAGLYEKAKDLSSPYLVMSKIREYAPHSNVFDGGDKIGFIHAIEYCNHYCDIESSRLDFGSDEDSEIVVNLNKYMSLYDENIRLKENAKYDAGSGVLHVSFNDLNQYFGMKVAVWSDETFVNQRDLVWYDAQRNDDGIWRVDVDAKNHGLSKTLKIHFYAIGRDGESAFVHGINDFVLEDRQDI